MQDMSRNHFKKCQIVSIQTPKNVSGVVICGQEEWKREAMILDVVGQMDGLDLALPLLVCAWFGMTFFVPDRESYVRHRPLVVVVVWRVSGPKGKVVAGPGFSSRPSLGCGRARGGSLSRFLVGRRSSAVDAVAIVHVVAVRRLVHVVLAVVV